MWKHKVGERIQPPPVRTQPGRPKRNRRKSKDEPKKVKRGEAVKLSKAGKPAGCSSCGVLGHNKRTCKKNQTTPTPKDTPLSQSSQTASSITRSQSHKSKMNHGTSETAPRPTVEVRDRTTDEGIWIREGSRRKTTATKKGKSKLTRESAVNGKGKPKPTEKCKDKAKSQMKGKEKATSQGKGKEKATSQGKEKATSQGKGKKAKAPWK